MNLTGTIGWSAFSIVVVLWLWVSFSASSPRRAVLEWLAASGIYVALSMLFLSLCLRAWESDSTVGLIAFGFLLLVFTCGCGVSLFHTARSLRGQADSGASATH